MIGFVSFLIFVEDYGIYLFFTETELYTADLVQNGLFGFTTFFIVNWNKNKTKEPRKKYYNSVIPFWGAFWYELMFSQ